MGLLDSLGSGIKGLLGNPDIRDSLLTSLAVTGPNSEERMALLMRQKAIQEEAKKAEELRQLQLEAYRRQMAQEDKLQQKDDLTGAFIQSINSQVSDAVARLRESLASNDPAGAEKARKDLAAFKSPEAQMNYRTYLATQGNPEMAMQAGLISPVQQEQATSKMREYEFARQNGYTGSFTDFMQLRSSAGRDPYYTVVPTTQGLMRFNSATGEMTPVGETPLVRPSDDPATQRALAEGKTSGKLTATSDADALSALPKVEASAVEMDRLLTELVNHPGKSYAVGTSSVMPVVPGTDAAGFMSRLDQIRGEAFLQAYERLRGGGAITQIEGEKGEQAIARLSRAQSEEEFDQAVADLQDVIAVGLARARRRAAQAQNRQPMSPVPGSSPAQNPADARLEELRQKYGM